MNKKINTENDLFEFFASWGVKMFQTEEWKFFYQRIKEKYQKFTDLEKIIFQNNEIHFFEKVALKILEGEKNLKGITSPTHFVIITPIYNEIQRLQNWSCENLIGENALFEKIEILKKLIQFNKNISITRIFVDDGCPYGSGEWIEKQLEGEKIINWKVLYMDKLLEEKSVYLPQGITGKQGNNPSKKGGAIITGANYIRENITEDKNTYILETDADMSVPLQVMGCLYYKIKNGYDIVVGSRRVDNSVAFIESSRNSKGWEFIKLWKKYLVDLGKVINDTNRGFKLYTFDSITELTKTPYISYEAYNYQLENLQKALKKSYKICEEGVVYIDSIENSNFDMSNSDKEDIIRKIAEKYLNFTE